MTPTTTQSVLMEFIVAHLAAMFLGAAAGDLARARGAAIETVRDYRGRNNADLLAIAQIIGFGLATVGSLTQSMAADLSLSMTLRLRGSATSLSRAAEQHRRARDPRMAEPATHRTDEDEEARPAEPEPDIVLTADAEFFLAAEAGARLADTATAPHPERFLTPAAEDLLAAEAQARLANPAIASEARPPAQPNRRTRARAMLKQAQSIRASIARLPAGNREAATRQAAALETSARELLRPARDAA